MNIVKIILNVGKSDSITYLIKHSNIKVKYQELKYVMTYINLIAL